MAAAATRVVPPDSINEPSEHVPTCEEEWKMFVPYHVNRFYKLATDPFDAKGGWSFSNFVQGVEVHTRDISNFHPRSIRGVFDVNLTAKEFAQTFWDIRNALIYDKHVGEARDVLFLDELAEGYKVKVVENCYPKKWGVSARQSVAIRAMSVLPNDCAELEEGWEAPIKKKGWFGRTSPDHVHPLVRKRDPPVEGWKLNSSLEEADDSSCFLIALFSVVCESDAPSRKSHVRSVMRDSSGFFLKPLRARENGTEALTRVVYVCNVDIGGIIPTFVMNKIAVDLPKIIPDICKAFDVSKAAVEAKEEEKKE